MSFIPLCILLLYCCIVVLFILLVCYIVSLVELLYRFVLQSVWYFIRPYYVAWCFMVLRCTEMWFVDLHSTLLCIKNKTIQYKHDHHYCVTNPVEFRGHLSTTYVHGIFVLQCIVHTLYSVVQVCIVFFVVFYCFVLYAVVFHCIVLYAVVFYCFVSDDFVMFFISI